MERRLALEVVDHKPPALAEKREDGLWDLSFDLDEVFHQGYIEVHDRPPADGTNPFLDEYANLLDPGEAALKWLPPGIARGDHKTSESQKLGRIFARAYLYMHRYRWFADVKELMKAPEDGWEVERPKKGALMPDWLVAGDGEVAVGEAKGTHGHVHKGSSVLDKEWRPQVANIIVKRNGIARNVKGWIVATRWVTSDRPRTEPKMYAEDPEVPGQPIGDGDLGSLVTWIARAHTTRGLLRLGRNRTAQRVAAPGFLRERLAPASPTTWVCQAPGLEHLQFIGRPMGAPPTLGPWEQLALWDFPFPAPIRAEVLRWVRLRTAWLDNALDEMWFDGVAVPIVQALVHDRPPPDLRGMDIHDGAHRPGVSLLRDGSLLAPMSLMKPGERIDV